MANAVLAIDTDTTRAAQLSTSEALTVEFKAPDLGALASMAGDWSGGWFLHFHVLLLG